MFKPRGKPHEAKNVSLAQQRLSLAETIRISSISKTPSFRSFTTNARGRITTNRQISGYSPFGTNVDRELRQQKQHFEAFREAYQERVGGKRVVYDTRNIRQSPPASERDSEEMRNFLSRYGVKKIAEIKKPPPPALPPKQTPKPPALVRNTIRTVKAQYPLQKLEFGADFMLEPQAKPILKKKSKECATMEAIKELKEIESKVVELESIENGSKNKAYSPEDRDELFKQLQATENQITVATSQLQAIQKILQDNRMLTTLQEDDEHDGKEKSCQTAEIKQKNQRIKWKVKTTLRGSQNKRTRLVDTLQLLNNRLQNMQDKYFNAPKVKYRTFDEILTQKKENKHRKGLETIYQNMKYDYDSTMDLDLQPTISSEMKQIRNKTDITVRRGKSEPKTRSFAVKGYDEDNDDYISRDRSSITTMTSSSMAVNDSKNSVDATLTGALTLTNASITSTNMFANSSRKFDVMNLKSSAELLSEINGTDVIFSQNKSFTGDGLKYNNIIFNEDFGEEEEEEAEEDEKLTTDNNNSGFEKAIEKSIKASNYLMKEFDSLRGDYGAKLDDMLVTKVKNVRFSEPRDIIKRVDQVCTPAADRIKHMFNKFDTILKDSLYSTTTTTGK